MSRGKRFSTFSDLAFIAVAEQREPVGAEGGVGDAVGEASVHEVGSRPPDDVLGEIRHDGREKAGESVCQPRLHGFFPFHPTKREYVNDGEGDEESGGCQQPCRIIGSRSWIVQQPKLFLMNDARERMEFFGNEK